MVTCGIKYWHCIASKKDHRHKNLTISHCSCRIQFFYHKSHTKQHFLTNPYCQLHFDCFHIIPISRECLGTRVQRFIHTHSEESEGIISEDADTQINPNLYCSVFPDIYHIYYGHILTILSHLQLVGNF